MKTRRLWLYGLMTKCLPENKFYGLKAAVLRWSGAVIGKNVRVCSSAHIYGNGRLIVGDDVWIGECCFIAPCGSSGLVIESHCDLAPGVMLINGSHEISPHGKRIAGQGVSESITIRTGSWVGARSVVLPGVELGPKTIVGAGSVVTKSFLSGCILVAGCPAREKKRYDK